MADETETPRPRHSRAGRIVVGLLALLLILGVGGYLGDSYARGKAADGVATSMQSYLGTAEKPQVDVGGFPFLTQVAANRYQQIQVRAKDVSALEIPLKTLDMKMTGVDADTSFSRAVAQHVEGGAMASWEEVSRRANNLPVAYEQPDRVKVEYETSVLGVNVKAVVTAKPAIDKAAQTIVLTDPVMNVAKTDLPQDVADGLLKSLVKPIPVPLPGALKATNARATAEGLIIDVEGDNVDLLNLQ